MKKKCLVLVLFVSLGLMGSEKKHRSLGARMSAVYMQKNFRNVTADDLIAYLQGLKIEDSSAEDSNIRPEPPVVAGRHIFRVPFEEKSDSDSDWDAEDVD